MSDSVSSSPVSSSVASSNNVSKSSTMENSAQKATDSRQVSAESASNVVPEQKPAKRAYKYKADGKEISEELDDNELQSRLAFAKSADKRMKEAAEVRKATEQFIRKLKENPLSVLNDERIMGSAKFREIAENFLLEQIKAEQMTPKQKLQAERDKELESLKAREKQREEEIQKQREAEATKHWQNEYQNTIISALEASGLPKNAESIAEIAKVMKKAMKAGLDMDVQYIAKKVKENYDSGFKSLVQNMDGEQLVKFFGDELLNKVRKYDLSRWQPKNIEVKSPNIPPPAAQTKVANVSPRDFREQLLKRNS